MPKKNRHGLSRDVPQDVQRALRREANFGCVKCGFTFGEYEHIDPEFKDATGHDPAAMAFLCKRCHGEVTSGRASKQSVWAAKARPYCRTRNDPSWAPIESGVVECELGSWLFRDSKAILSVLGDVLLSFRPPEIEGGPPLLSVKFFESGALAFEVKDNGILVGSENWDVSTIGRTLTIRKSKAKKVLVCEFQPPNKISLTHLSLTHRDIRIEIRDSKLGVSNSSYMLEGVGSLFNECSSCVSVWESGITIGDASHLGASAHISDNKTVLEFVALIFLHSIIIARSVPVTLTACEIRGGIFMGRGSQVRLNHCVVGPKIQPATTLNAGNNGPLPPKPTSS